MANGYFDLGTWCGITPFVGGVGWAHHTVSGFNDTAVGYLPGGFGSARSKDTSDFAWNLQAGVSYDITTNFKVDVGYRYIHLGSAKTNKVICIANGCAAPLTYAMKYVTAHDVKIGLRYMIGGAVAAPMPPLGTIARKY